MVEPLVNADPLLELADFLDRRMLRHLHRELRQLLYLTGRAAKPAVGRELDSAFKIGGKRVAGAFGVYTTGRTLGSLRLGIFTRWQAAGIYQRGGRITPSRGRYLVVPVTARAYTAAGRVKRSWRTPDGKFKPHLFEDLKRIKPKKGPGILLVRDVEATVAKHPRTGRRTSVRVGTRRAPNAVEPVFLLIPFTSRKPVLRFFKRFERFLAAEGGRRLQEGFGQIVDRAARERR